MQVENARISVLEDRDEGATATSFEEYLHDGYGALLVLFGLVHQRKAQRLPYVQVGEMLIIFGIVVDFTFVELCLLLRRYTAVCDLAFDSRIYVSLVSYYFQESRAIKQSAWKRSNFIPKRTPWLRRNYGVL